MAPLEGPVAIAALADAVLLGCVIVQSCMYFKNSERKVWLLTILVSLILLLLLSHLSCMAAWLWASMQADIANISVPGFATILFGLSSVFGAVILLFERFFFSYRILKETNNHLLAFAFFILCIFSFTAGVGAASVFFMNATADITSQLGGKWIFPLMIISGLVCDMAISIAAAYCLRSQIPTDITDAMGRVTRLFHFLAETGCVTSLFGLVTVIVVSISPTSLKNTPDVVAVLADEIEPLFVSMPGVFANAFLAALNSRSQLCDDITHQRRFGIGEELIDSTVKRQPIMIAISHRVEKHSEKNPV
ncbi:hypothetical protein JVU11DRAFT_11809 [Chiua virens]|nr:hypothetical protein JVU11DRAFT_11809 [Chiua virens]